MKKMIIGEVAMRLYTLGERCNISGEQIKYSPQAGLSQDILAARLPHRRRLRRRQKADVKKSAVKKPGPGHSPGRVFPLLSAIAAYLY